jgi:hypothetical protein
MRSHYYFRTRMILKLKRTMTVATRSKNGRYDRVNTATAICNEKPLNPPRVPVYGVSLVFKTILAVTSGRTEGKTGEETRNQRMRPLSMRIFPVDTCEGNIPMRKDYQDPKYIQGLSEIRED